VRLRAILAGTGLAGLLCCGFAAPALGAEAPAGVTADESRLLSDVNQARAAVGLPALIPAAGTTEVALGWTAHLVAMSGLMHNPNLLADLESHGSANWTTAAENVGYGPAGQPDVLFAAYMNSPEHRANILDPSVRYIGIGVIDGTVDGSPTMFDTMDFVDAYQGPRVAAPSWVKLLSFRHPLTATARGGAAPRLAGVALASRVLMRVNRQLNLSGYRVLGVGLAEHGRAALRVVVSVQRGTRLIVVGVPTVTAKAHWLNLRLPAAARSAVSAIVLQLPAFAGSAATVDWYGVRALLN
jgi:hypothetical protein